MKKLSFIIAFCLFGLYACGQDHTFDVPVIANKGVTFPDGKTQIKAWDGTSTGTNDFNLLIRKCMPKFRKIIKWENIQFC